MVIPGSAAVEAGTAGALTGQIRDLRAIDHRSGGGCCLDGALTLIHRARRIAPGSAEFDVALADLHSLAGWAAFDIGLTELARTHFDEALLFAGQGGDDRLLADIFHRLGRMRLHHGDPGGALEYFQRGRSVACRRGTGGEVEAAILSVNEAWAHATMGSVERACAMLDRGVDQFAAVGDGDRPDWSMFFSHTEVRAMIGTVHTELAVRVDPRHAGMAISALTEAVGGYGDDMARSRTLSLILLAMSHLVGGDVGRGAECGLQALACAENLASERVRDRMRSLGQLTRRHESRREVRELQVRIKAFTTTQGRRP